MTDSNNIPVFAVVGHPNEGKSSVVSTLAEDDQVRISPTPGETVVCQSFPVIIDGVEVIRFIDTPGFQNPKRILRWMTAYQGPEERIVPAFQKSHQKDPAFKDDRELLNPIATGAGIIYVVDGSRPIRSVDRAEMEILRLTGRPRMAIINCKERDTTYLEQWKHAFRRQFNAIRVFNAHRATYAERISLLESLKGIDQDWMTALQTVINAFQKEWRHRNALTAEIICTMLTASLTYSVTKNYTDKTDPEALKKRLYNKYTHAIAEIEKSAHQHIRRLFKHNIFNYDLPPQSIVHEELFDEKTWQLLGLTRRQLTALAGITGGTIGAAIDMAAAGLTFGIFTAIGGAVGAGWAALGGGKQLSGSKVAGVPLGGKQFRVGPHQNIQFLYILLDRALIFYSHIINWAHGRRDDLSAEHPEKITATKAGYTAGWGMNAQKKCTLFFKTTQTRDEVKQAAALKALKTVVEKELIRISTSQNGLKTLSK